MSDKKELLFSLSKDAKDFVVQPFMASGSGGRHRDNNATAIRIIHPESGAVAECQEFRSQNQNKKKAFERLVQSKEFVVWHKLKSARLCRAAGEIEGILNKWIKPENFKVEVYDKSLKKHVEVDGPTHEELELLRKGINE